MQIAVIPARSGSKRIPRKNIREFCGRPMLSWAIDTALDSKLFDQVIVSTDDADIAALARDCGAQTPFVRPAELSGDFVGTTPVIAHATQWAIDKGWTISAVCCIYATAPFLQKNDLQAGHSALTAGDWSFAFSATDFSSTVFRAFREHESGGVEMFFPQHFETRSQDLPAALHDAAQFYWGRPEAWLRNKSIFARHSTPVHIPRWRVLDIDTEEDWLLAELMHEILTTKGMLTSATHHHQPNL